MYGLACAGFGGSHPRFRCTPGSLMTRAGVFLAFCCYSRVLYSASIALDFSWTFAHWPDLDLALCLAPRWPALPLAAAGASRQAGLHCEYEPRSWARQRDCRTLLYHLEQLGQQQM